MSNVTMSDDVTIPSLSHCNGINQINKFFDTQRQIIGTGFPVVSRPTEQILPTLSFQTTPDMMLQASVHRTTPIPLAGEGSFYKLSRSDPMPKLVNQGAYQNHQLGTIWPSGFVPNTGEMHSLGMHQLHQSTAYLPQCYTAPLNTPYQQFVAPLHIDTTTGNDPIPTYPQESSTRGGLLKIALKVGPDQSYAHNRLSPAMDLRMATVEGTDQRMVFQPVMAVPPTVNTSNRVAYAKLVKTRKTRITFSSVQVEALEAKFQENKYLNVDDRKKLAGALLLEDRQVKTWFQNRRMRWKRQQPNNEALPMSKAKTVATKLASNTNAASRRTSDVEHRTPATPFITPASRCTSESPSSAFNLSSGAPPSMNGSQFPWHSRFPAIAPSSVFPTNLDVMVPPGLHDYRNKFCAEPPPRMYAPRMFAGNCPVGFGMPRAWSSASTAPTPYGINNVRHPSRLV